PTPVPTPTPTAVPTPPPAEDSDFYYFSYDDSASTAGVELSKAALRNHKWPDRSWVRPWEFLNLEPFSHASQQPAGLFKVSMGIWQHPDVEYQGYDDYELGVHISAPDLDRASRRNLVLTLVLDVSGSMEENAGGGESKSKLELARSALQILARSLKPGDVVNLITFSDDAQTLLDRVQIGPDLSTYQQTVASLHSQGGTNLNAGLQMAYDVARSSYDRNKINRVVMLTDAYANIGETDANQISYYTRINNAEGIYFSGLGFGQDFNEAFLNELTEAGRGAYFSIITQRDVNRAMDERFMALINVAAREVKFRLDYPKVLQRFATASEESSQVESHVQATNFSYNTSQFFLEQFAVPTQSNLLEQKIRLTIYYSDPVSGQKQVQIVEKRLGEILGIDLENIKDAHLVNLLTGVLKGEVGVTRARSELEMIGQRGGSIAQEYRGLLHTALELSDDKNPGFFPPHAPEE
ncbi:MAG TPA: VWA domain-containing protein, partial [Candidatus Obscuribacterales bacterium]